MNRYRTKARVGDPFDMEVRRITEEHTGHRDGPRPCAQSYDGNSRIEAAHEFLQHENGAADGRIECRSKTSPRTGSQKHLAVIFVATKEFSDQMGSTRPHLHNRSFTAERQAGTNCEHASNELHRYQAIHCLHRYQAILCPWQLSAQHRLDLGDAAAGCLR